MVEVNGEAPPQPKPTLLCHLCIKEKMLLGLCLFSVFSHKDSISFEKRIEWKM
jgi:hypothetical protein